MAECEICDWHGPDLGTTQDAFRNLHRALHDLVRPIERSLKAIIDHGFSPAPHVRAKRGGR